MRILVVDEDPLDREEIHRHLLELGDDVDAVATYRRAAIRHRDHPYDLIVTELQESPGEQDLFAAFLLRLDRPAVCIYSDCPPGHESDLHVLATGRLRKKAGPEALDRWIASCRDSQKVALDSVKA